MTKCLTGTKAIPTGTLILNGKFSSIIELKIALNGERVVGKIVNIDPSDTKPLLTTVKEINQNVTKIMSLSHENVVGIKEVCFLPDEIMPVLLMEPMVTDLHSYLKDHPSSISLKQRIGILYDIASGLEYLHSLDPPFIHGNLTTDNVLLDSELKAKIGGLSIVSTSHRYLNTNYLPPVAQESSRQSQYSLDIFSFGHLVLCTVLQEQVGPLLAAQYVSETGQLSIRHEVDRRASFIEKVRKMLSDKEPLFTIINDCLSNLPSQRPSARDLHKILLSETGKFSPYIIF